MVDIFYRKYCRWYNCYYEKIGSNIKNISDEIPFEIPSTWSWQKIKAICEIKGGKRIPKGMTFQKEKTDHIYIRVTDMKDETISEDNLVYISDSIFNLIKNYTVSKEDLYVTVAGTIGRCGNVPDNFDGMNLTENADKLTNLIVNKEWVLTVLTSKYAIDAMNYKAHQVAQPKLSIETLGNIFIPIPPKNEIRKILSIIKDSKALLSNLDKEIISLEDIVNQTKQKILEHFFGENSCYKSYYEKEYNLDELLPYEQPRPFIVNSTNYSDAYETPVLTPGKSFILGYTNETEGVYDVKDSKVIIFDDFTTASRLIDFNFKVKSSAIKILHCSDKDKFDIDYLFYKLQRINVIPDTHKRFWISEYAPLKLKIHTSNEQKKIVKVITDSFTILDSMSKSI